MSLVFLRGVSASLIAAVIAAAVVVSLAVPATAEVCVKRNGDTIACVQP